ncbi:MULTISPECIES: hypothetical protein [Cyanophyceae]|uniref:hypothetical protein n=1 Tax=Cyanophyceae TaxID=3028117 RepID=UPI00232F3806|nr:MULTISPECIES: hypothetical protein [Cyanophyceae]MDB9357890.1 hypothetical protein [Nodularia spumigena CS-587/03]MDB9338616.1 hypothetical protein [Nodularia spumigena CS-589/07]MDB9349262.1 hypothetical protein [Nodularia spumigena CS-588/01]MDB9351649.1 hypothetical protein [Nodularia spumigena CS-588/05]MDB9399813.1 hypothetical protein [Microcystis aeruginosa CS-567/02-A1]
MTDKSQPEREVNKSDNSPTEAHKSVCESVAETVQAVGKVGEAITHTAAEAGKIVLDTSIGAGVVAAKETYKLIEKGTQTTGDVVNHISENWFVRKLTGVLNLNWLIGASENVDLEKAEASVNKLKQKYPDESPSQIAHRIMVDKARKAGGIGLASSILPGVAAALLAIDLAATTKLQSEMIYEIAAVYGLDLKDPARKGEVLGIFGLGLGGGRLLRLGGLGLLRNVPFAGAAIATSTNATMIYSLGYAACRFYEAKLDESASLTSPETLATLQAQSQEYLETALAQEAIMDQILVQMILASYPQKTWEEILPELKAANLSDESLQEIAQNIKSPQPLDQLLKQLNPDFAIALVARCQEIAQENPDLASPLLSQCEKISQIDRSENS